MPLDKAVPTVNHEALFKAIDGLVESQQNLIDMQNDLIGRLMERIRTLESPVAGAGIEGLKTK